MSTKRLVVLSLSLALFSGSVMTYAQSDKILKKSNKIMICKDKILGQKFAFNMNTFITRGSDLNEVPYWEVTDFLGVKHSLNLYMTTNYLECREVKL